MNKETLLTLKVCGYAVFAASLLFVTSLVGFSFGIISFMWWSWWFAFRITVSSFVIGLCTYAIYEMAQSIARNAIIKYSGKTLKDIDNLIKEITESGN